MLKNYLRIALRNSRRHWAYSLINVLGLALSMSVCLLIILLIQDQLSYDRFHEHSDRIYRVIADRVRGDGTSTFAATPAYLGPAIEREVPGIEETVRLAQIRTNLIHQGKSLQVKGIYAEPSFFDVFSFVTLRGDPHGALRGPNKVLLSEETAGRIFGETDPLGQIITLEGGGDFTVTGLVKTNDVKSHLQFDVLASFATLETLSSGRERLAQDVSFWWFATYVLLDDGVSTESLETYLETISRRYAEIGHGEKYFLKLQPLTGITLGPYLQNEISSYSLPLFVVLLLGGLGLVVMLAAGFNYIGLTVARSLQRAREVGIRKSVGAFRGQVIRQFLVESMLLALAALLLAYVLLGWLVPGLNGLSVMRMLNVQLDAAAVFDPRLAGVFVAFSLTIGLLAGLYPAVYLSKFDPVLVLKGAGLGRGSSRLRLRKVLVTTQLVFSLAFIITGVLIYRQFEYMVGFDYGFRTDDLINVDLQGVPYTKFRDELLRHPGVLNVAAMSHAPVSGGAIGTGVARAGADTLSVNFYSVDAHFLNSLDVKLAAGSNFQVFRDLIKVIGITTFIAVAIAILGLLAMATYNAQARTKEVGIRKVLGATLGGVAWLLSREFLLLIPIALAVAIPLAWFGNNLWLEQIAHRVSFGPAIFAASTALLFGLAVLAIGTQAMRAALADPAESLRYE